MTFNGLLSALGRDFAKGLNFAVTYAVPAEKLAALLFPSVSPAAAAVVDATSLIQTAVLQVEQKFAASGVQSGTGTQKLAEVMLLAAAAVTQLLSQAGVSSNTAYVQSLVSAVVAILNAQVAPTAATAVAAKA